MNDECLRLMFLFREEWSERARRGEVNSLGGVEILIMHMFATWVDERRLRLMNELLKLDKERIYLSASEAKSAFGE